MTEHSARSAVKAFTWRVVATLTTTMLVYVFTGELTLAIEVGALELVLKMLLYFLHERAWGSYNVLAGRVSVYRRKDGD